MNQSLNRDNNSIMEETLHDDWPLLQELETTRFSIKNKRNSKKENTLDHIRQMSEKEDDLISAQNIADEQLVDAFLDNKEPISEQKVIDKINDRVPPQVMTQPIRNQLNEVEENFRAKQAMQDNEETSTLVARGLGKVYVEKTNIILAPLKFLIFNTQRILMGLFQFIIPAIITWILINYSDVVKLILSREPEYTQYLYIGIFYFACLFLSSTSQVVVSGIINVSKMIINNLICEAKK